jgi:hypothetical protein
MAREFLIKKKIYFFFFFAAFFVAFFFAAFFFAMRITSSDRLARSSRDDPHGLHERVYHIPTRVEARARLRCG